MGLFVKGLHRPQIVSIIETDDPENVKQYDFFHIVKPSSILNFLSHEYPFMNDPFNAVPGGYLKDFGYYIGLFDGPTLEFLHDGRVATNVWESGIKNILQLPFPYVTDNNGIFHVNRSTWKGPMYFTSTSWIRKLVGADVANAKGYNGTGITVCVTDTGGTKSNVQTVRMGKYTTVNQNFYDAVGHGEHTASTIGGARAVAHELSAIVGKKVECEGMAPGCTLISIKCLDYVAGFGTDAQLLKALQKCIDLGADVVNASWGSAETAKSPEEDPYYKVVKAMDEKYNILFVASSGDSGPGPSPSSPASVPNAISVGSINAVSNSNPSFGPAGYVSGFSGRGPVPWGNQVYPTTTTYGAIFASAITGWMRGSYLGIVTSDYNALAGTSMSGPICSGLLACMRQAHRQLLGKTLTREEVVEMLSTVGMDYWGIDDPYNNEYGYGPINWDIYEQYVSEKYGVKV